MIYMSERWVDPITQAATGVVQFRDFFFTYKLGKVVILHVKATLFGELEVELTTKSTPGKCPTWSRQPLGIYMADLAFRLKSEDMDMTLHHSENFPVRVLRRNPEQVVEEVFIRAEKFRNRSIIERVHGR